MPRWIAWIQDEHEYGTTIPVVPSTDSPPMMPSLAFIVRSARRSPPGIAIVTVTSGPIPPERAAPFASRSEEHTSELQSRSDLVCRLLLEKKKKKQKSKLQKKKKKKKKKTK